MGGFVLAVIHLPAHAPDHGDPEQATDPHDAAVAPAIRLRTPLAQQQVVATTVHRRHAPWPRSRQRFVQPTGGPMAGRHRATTLRRHTLRGTQHGTAREHGTPAEANEGVVRLCAIPPVHSRMRLGIPVQYQSSPEYVCYPARIRPIPYILILGDSILLSVLTAVDL